MTDQHLRRLLDPSSIAIAGLSADPAKHGARVLGHLRAHGFPGGIYGVNPGMPSVEGVEMFRAVDEIPDPPDLVVAAVPSQSVAGVVAASAGVGGVVVFASGFAEAGDPGAELQDELVRIAGDTGTRLLGPNSGGIIRPSRSLTASFLTCLDRPPGQLVTGPVGVVTQSGGTGSFLHNFAAGRGQGLAISVSTGNEADIRLGEALAAVSGLEEVEAIVVVLETVRDGMAFMSAAQQARSRGQHIVVCRLGRSDRAAGMMTSHTGSLAVPERILTGIFAGLGIPVAETPAEAYEVACLLAGQKAAPGGAAGVLTHSGGVAILLADLAETNGVPLPAPSPRLSDRLGELLDHGSVSNPIDMGGIIGGPGRFAEVTEVMAESGEYDAILAVSTAHPPSHTEERVEALVGLDSSVPVFHLWMAGDVSEIGLERLRSADRPVTEEPRAAMRALAGLLASPSVGPGPNAVAGPEAEEGLPIDRGVAAHDADEAVSAATALGFPVVVKVDVRGLAHKSDIQGVALDLRNPDEVRDAFRSVVGSAETAGLRAVGVTVQRFRPGLELLVGAIRHESFGPLVSVGAGGVLTEVLGDVAFRPAPVGIPEARAMIEGLALRPLLDGYRGSPPADVDGLARIVALVSEWVAGTEGLTEVEINPLIWDGTAWVGADLLIARNPDQGAKPYG